MNKNYNNNIGLYIHVPFCVSKCPYCDFYSIAPSGSSINDYVKSLLTYINTWALKLKNKTIVSIYFGGGTPCLIPPFKLHTIINEIYNKFNVTKNAEITLEVNPKILTYSELCDYFSLGINRLSVGMQSVHDNELKALGRIHCSSDTINTVKMAHSAGFNNISLDLMLCIPEQTNASLKESIKLCDTLGALHVSAYLLKIEKGTHFFKIKNNFSYLNEDFESDFYLTACEYLDALGFNQYEISNFSKNKPSQHNLIYWRCQEYLGLGPSAHSFIDGKRFYYTRSFDEFLNTSPPVDDGEGGNFSEFVMLALRLTEGLKNSETLNRFGCNIPDSLIKKARILEKKGLINIYEDFINLTTSGFLLSNSIINYLLN